MPVKRLQAALNAFLPDDIVITSTDEVDLDFHSRFAAKSKIYRYTILNRSSRSALLKNRVYFYRAPLDTKLMHQEARVLLGEHDFMAFQATDKLNRVSLRTIKKIEVIRDGDLIHVDIESDGFGHNMVRIIVGTLIEIGRGKFSKGSLKKILLSKDRKLAGPTVPPWGLSLVKVKY